jgi:hypothetical protein
LPDVFWTILFLGAGISIALSVFFLSEVPLAHGLMAVASAVIICTGIWLVVELDYPLSGDIYVKPDAFEHVVSVINAIQSGQL